MTHQEVFTELLHDFREGYTLYGASLFSIWAVPFSDREKIHSEVMDSYIGSVPSSDDSPGDGYALFCKIQDSNTPDTLYLSEAFNLYRNLASKAGGHFPCQLRQQIPFEPSGPISWWLSFMWNLGCPPSEEDLLQPNDVENVYRLISCEPFLDSANAIEAFGLHLPDSVENMKGNPKGSNSDEILVTVKQIARMVHLEEKSIGSHTKKKLARAFSSQVWPKTGAVQMGRYPPRVSQPVS